MKITQVYSIINSLAKQSFGDTAVTVTDLASFVQMGDTVLSSDTNKDSFLGTLLDRIGRVVISNRAYEIDDQDVLMDTFEYGAIMQKLYVDYSDAQETSQWALQDGKSVDQYIVKKQTAKQKLFSNIVSWEVQATITDFQLKTAFTSPTEFSAFVNAQFIAMQTSMAVQLEKAISACYANFIGEKIYNSKQDGYAKMGVVKLLTAYKTATGDTSMTAEKARTSVEFLKFAVSQIMLTQKRMKKMSSLFNDEGYRRHTPEDLARVTLLNEFSTNVSTFLQSDTYHKELVELPKYKEVPYWQGSGTDYSFANTSTIDIKTSSGHTIKQSNIIGLISDVEAIGVTIDNRRSKSAYNNRGEYTNYWEKADMGYFNDLSENGVVFIIE